MIKLAVVTRDENFLQLIKNIPQREKDINILSTILVKDLENEVKKAIDFIKQLTEQKPDIFFLDQGVLRDAAALNLEILLSYRDKVPAMKTIIAGIRFNEENVMAMMQGGIRGFFRFSLDQEQLIKCIRVVAQGELWLEAKLITPVFDEFIKEFMKRQNLLKSLTELKTEKLETLSQREMEILELISHSMTNEEIAEKLFLSPKTVKTHLRNIFSKSGMRNRVEAALVYTRHAMMSH